jgi:transposase, IS5 family
MLGAAAILGSRSTERSRGDANNANLAVVGYNFSLLLRWLGLLLHLILAALSEHPAPAAKAAAA